MARDIPAKGWTCPGCGKPVTYDTMKAASLQRAITGWEVKDAGRWYVKGICPHCGKWIQFTKHGAGVLRSPYPLGAPATIITRKERR